MECPGSGCTFTRIAGSPDEKRAACIYCGQLVSIGSLGVDKDNHPRFVVASHLQPTQ